MSPLWETILSQNGDFKRVSCGALKSLLRAIYTMICGTKRQLPQSIDGDNWTFLAASRRRSRRGCRIVASQAAAVDNHSLPAARTESDKSRSIRARIYLAPRESVSSWKGFRGSQGGNIIEISQGVSAGAWINRFLRPW
jgi:hypothetical protein